MSTQNISFSHAQMNKDLWKKIHSFVIGDLDALEEYLAELIKENIPFVKEIGEQLFYAGGKRIRPILLFLTSKLCGYKGEYLFPLASAIELIHTATLLHDDVIDESPMRRGNPTAHSIWGNKASILVGDFLFSKAFTCMVRANSIDIMQALAKSSQRIATGELLELSEAHSLNLTYEMYLEIIEAKTAALFQTACEVGAFLGGVSISKRKALITYGYVFGLLFQMQDDLIDYIGDPTQSGKVIGGDFKEKKITLPVILAYQQASSAEKKFWEEAFSEKEHSTDSFIKARSFIQKYKIPSLIYDKTLFYHKKALEALNVFSPSQEKELLEDFLKISFLRTV